MQPRKKKDNYKNHLRKIAKRRKGGGKNKGDESPCQKKPDRRVTG